jgi:hypothetical protein
MCIQYITNSPIKADGENYFVALFARVFVTLCENFISGAMRFTHHALLQTICFVELNS